MNDQITAGNSSNEELREHEVFVEALKECQKLQTTIVHSLQAGIVIIDAETHEIVDVNPTALKMIGLPKTEVMGQICHNFICPAEKGKCPITDLGQMVDKSERVLLNGDGKSIPILKTVASINLNNRKRLVESFLDISALKQTEKDLQRAKIEADIANQTKSKFLANMSHEIRTPLNAIIGFSDVLVAQNQGQFTAKQEHYLNNISRSGKYLLELINQILDLSKVEAGKMELYLENFGINTIIDDVNSVLAPLAMKKNITLNYEISPAMGTIMADKTKLKQILFNLISNSIKFTPNGGIVNIEAIPLGSDAQFKICDTGNGISEEDLPTIFEPFRQLENAASTDHSGTGLGLPLVKSLVELHGGEVEVESEVGKGTTFTFTIPQISK